MPTGAIASADTAGTAVRPGDATITTAGLEIIDVAGELIDECGALAMARNPGLRGTLALAVQLETDPEIGNLIASAEINKEKTTITDRELIECATENVFATEEFMAKLREQGDRTGGNIVMQFEKVYPPPPRKPPDWPYDDSSPSCPEGTRLTGDKPPEGTSQWCELPDGTRHGDVYVWDDGMIAWIQVYDRGRSNTVQMRPRDLPRRQETKRGQ